jgi:RNA polymerase sigma-70 factor (ECF subfamily)
VARVRRGDVDAFTELYHEHVEGLWRFATGLLQAPDVAKDVVQDVFFTLWNVRESWAPETSVRAYLFRAARNRAISVVRHDTIVARTTAAIDDHDEIPGMGTPMPGTDDAVLTRDTRDALWRSVQALPERQRSALLLWWRDELSVTEVAAVLGISVPAAHKLLATAQGRLVRDLSPHPPREKGVGG